MEDHLRFLTFISKTESRKKNLRWSVSVYP